MDDNTGQQQNLIGEKCPWKHFWHCSQKCHIFYRTSSFWDICMFSFPVT